MPTNCLFVKIFSGLWFCVEDKHQNVQQVEGFKKNYQAQFFKEVYYTKRSDQCPSDQDDSKKDPVNHKR